MKKITFLLFCILFSYISYSQCINGTQNSSAIALNDGNVQELSGTVETNEYVTVTNIIPGDQYVFTNTHSDSGTKVHEYITIRNSSNVLIVSGMSPLSTSAISESTIRIHISVDAVCNVDAYFHSVTNVNLSKVTCNKPESPGISYKSNTRIDFYWSPPAYSSPIDYDWEIVPDGNAQGIGVIVSGSTGGVTNASSGNVLSTSTSYSIYVRSNCDASGNSPYLGPLNFTTNSNPPPTNDLCNGAITIVEETNIPDAASATPTWGTLLGGAGTDVNAEVCGSDPDPGNARDDVWYKFLAQSSNVHITVQPSPNFDIVITLYSGDCNTLSYLSCSDVNISSPSTEEIDFTGLTLGNTYYTRVYYYGTSTPATPTFNIKIWTPGSATDVDGDGYSDAVDCDDNNASIYPGAPEVTANGIDENCDGMYTWYEDLDGDGFGTTTVVTSSNSSPGAGESANSTDCNDSDASIYPGATEVTANGIDENCDGMYTWYEDLDGDGFGTTTVVTSSNSSPGAGESANSTDCNDSDASIYPGATEVTANGIDENCDGMFTWYEDLDGDGFGTTTVVTSSNSSPGAGESANSTDCNDSDASIYPGATEVTANGIDENCDGMFTWYEDLDGDGYGTTTVITSSNSSPGAGESSLSSDCDDSNSAVNPGQTEIEGNGLDDDCNPSTPDVPLGIDEYKLEELKIMPNPFNQSFTVHLPEGTKNVSLEVGLYDLNGRALFQKSMVNNNGILIFDNLSSLSQGIYLIKIASKEKNNIVVRQLIKY